VEYTKIYNNLISIAINSNRVKSDKCYYESHHIIPTALGGSNEVKNVVLLTAREHFISHWLLWKMQTSISDKHKMGHAFGIMRIHSTTNRYYSSRGFEIARKAHAAAASFHHKGKKLTPDQLEKRRSNNPNARETIVNNITYPNRKSAMEIFGPKLKRYIKFEISYLQLIGEEEIPRKQGTPRPKGLDRKPRNPDATKKALETKTKNGNLFRSIECRRKISESRKGKVSPNKGKHCSAETKKLISENRRKSTYILTNIEGDEYHISETHLGHWFKENMNIEVPDCFSSISRIQHGIEKIIKRDKWKGWKIVRFDRIY